MAETKSYYKIQDVCKVLECSQSVGYKVMRQLNDELRAKGYITISGRVNVAYFNERVYNGAKT